MKLKQSNDHTQEGNNQYTTNHSNEQANIPPHWPFRQPPRPSSIPPRLAHVPSCSPLHTNWKGPPYNTAVSTEVRNTKSAEVGGSIALPREAGRWLWIRWSWVGGRGRCPWRLGGWREGWSVKGPWRFVELSGWQRRRNSRHWLDGLVRWMLDWKPVLVSSVLRRWTVDLQLVIVDAEQTKTLDAVTIAAELSVSMSASSSAFVVSSYT